MVEDVTERFAALVARQDQPLPVDEALLLIAAHADPTLDIDAQKGRLDELAAQVEEPSVEALRDLLFDRLGLRRRPQHLLRGRELAAPVRPRPSPRHPAQPVAPHDRGRAPLRGRRSRASGCPATTSCGRSGRPTASSTCTTAGACSTSRAATTLFERVQAGVPWDEALPPARRAVGARVAHARQPGRRLPASRRSRGAVLDARAEPPPARAAPTASGASSGCCSARRAATPRRPTVLEGSGDRGRRRGRPCRHASAAPATDVRARRS